MTLYINANLIRSLVTDVSLSNGKLLIDKEEQSNWAVKNISFENGKLIIETGENDGVGVFNVDLNGGKLIVDLI